MATGIEVTRAGGLGMIAMGHFDNVDKLEKEIDLYVENTQILRQFVSLVLALCLHLQNG